MNVFAYQFTADLDNTGVDATYCAIIWPANGIEMNEALGQQVADQNILGLETAAGDPVTIESTLLLDASDLPEGRTEEDRPNWRIEGGAVVVTAP